LAASLPSWNSCRPVPVRGCIRIAQGGRAWRLRLHRRHAAGQAAQAQPAPGGRNLRTALLATAPYQRWVEAIDIAGPGFINIRLKPEAKQQVSEVLAGGARFGMQPSNGRKLMVEFVSANPTGPLHVGHGRQAALGDAVCNLYATQGWDVTREFYYNDAGVQIATLANSTQLRAKGFKPGDAGWPEAAYNGEYIQDIANDFLGEKDGACRRPRIHRQRRRQRPGRHPPVCRGLPAPRAGPGPEGLSGEV
jgi:arginyl-tRNA synthetase